MLRYIGRGEKVEAAQKGEEGRASLLSCNLHERTENKEGVAWWWEGGGSSARLAVNGNSIGFTDGGVRHVIGCDGARFPVCRLLS